MTSSFVRLTHDESPLEWQSAHAPTVIVSRCDVKVRNDSCTNAMHRYIFGEAVEGIIQVINSILNN